MKNRLTSEYEGITRYAGVPTEWTTGRLHFNENLYGPSPKCFDTLKQLVPTDLCLYESNAKDELIEELSKKLDIPSENLFLNNGSAENLKSFISMFAHPGDTILLPDPGWSYYYGVADYRFVNIAKYNIIENETKCAHDIKSIREQTEKYNPKIMILTTPAMPTGNKMADEDLEDIIRSYPDTLVIVDEAYYGFSEYTLDVRRIIETYDNVVFSRSFSKYYGLANLRVGYGICSKELKKVLWLDMPLHRLSHIVKRMAIAALNDKEYYDTITAKLVNSREKFSKKLNEVPGVTVYESDANFVYIKLVGYDADKIKQKAEENGFLIRVFTGNNEKHLRITIGTEEMMDTLGDLMIRLLQESKI